jgi:hypothetical protein
MLYQPVSEALDVAYVHVLPQDTEFHVASEHVDFPLESTALQLFAWVALFESVRVASPFAMYAV